MALFDFFRPFSFFKGRDTEGMVAEDLDFPKWVAAHRNWRSRLIGFIDGTSDEALDENVVCLDNRCELGKWIHGHGDTYYGDLATFQQLRTQHADFHLSAGRVIKVFKAEGREPARKLLHADFDLQSIRVVRQLEALEQEVTR